MSPEPGRWRTRLLTAISLVGLASQSPVLLEAQGRPGSAATLSIRATKVPLDRSDPTRDRVGELRYLDGWVLESDDPAFGGISGLVRLDAGFLAIGDAGGVFRFAFDSVGGLSAAEIAVLPDGPTPAGGPRAQKEDRDAESLVYDPATDRYWVGFERAHEIWRYGADMAGATGHRAPPAMRGWPANGGVEAMLRLHDGRFIVFAETAPGPEGSSEVLEFSSDPTETAAAAIRFGYRAPVGYQITDAALLPDGRVLALNRRFSVPQGLSAIVSVLELGDIAESDVLEGRPIGRLDAPLTIDNLEAMAVEMEGGRTVIWLASDDNFHPLQRTLLLKFAWEPVGFP